MIVKEKLRICIIKDGKVSRKIPEEFGRLFLKHFMKSNGWTISGSAFAGENDFLVWQKESENKELQDILPIQIIDPEVCSLVESQNHWFNVEVSIIVKTSIQ